MKTTTFNYFIRRKIDGKFWKPTRGSWKHYGEENWTCEKRGWMEGALSFTIKGAYQKKKELLNLGYFKGSEIEIFDFRTNLSIGSLGTIYK